MLRVTLARLLGVDDVLARLQDNVQQALNEATAPAISGGRLIEGVEITAYEDKEVNHGLDSPLRGWLVVRNDTEAIVWDAQADSPAPSKTLTLRANTDCTVSVWVF